MKRALSWFLCIALSVLCGPALAQSESLVILLQDHNIQTEEDVAGKAADGDEASPFQTRYQAAKARLAAQYPGLDTRIDTLLPSTSPFETLSGHADAYDILYMSAPDLQGLYEEGLIADLWAYPQIREALADWPDILSPLGDGEHLFALPEHFYPHLVQVVAPQLLAEIGITADDQTWTWDTLFEMGETLRAYNEANGTAHRLIASRVDKPYWLTQFVHDESVTQTDGAVDTETLTRLLSQWKQLQAWGLICETWEAEMDGDVIFRQGVTNFPIFLQDSANMLLPPAYREGAPRAEVSAACYFVNAASPRLDEAVDFLAAFSSREAVENAFEYWMNGIFLTGERLRDDIGVWDGKPVPLPNAEADALWREAIETGFQQRLDPAQNAAFLSVRAYMLGEISLEQCVEEVANGILSIQ